MSNVMTQLFAADFVNTNEIVRLPANAIRVAPVYAGVREVDLEACVILREQISSSQQNKPLVVKQVGESEEYVVVAGHHRLVAMLGYSMFPELNLPAGHDDQLAEPDSKYKGENGRRVQVHVIKADATEEDVFRFAQIDNFAHDLTDHFVRLSAEYVGKMITATFEQFGTAPFVNNKGTATGKLIASKDIFYRVITGNLYENPSKDIVKQLEAKLGARKKMAERAVAKLREECRIVETALTENHEFKNGGKFKDQKAGLEPHQWYFKTEYLTEAQAAERIESQPEPEVVVEPEFVDEPQPQQGLGAMVIASPATIAADQAQHQEEQEIRDAMFNDDHEPKVAAPEKATKKRCPHAIVEKLSDAEWDAVAKKQYNGYDHQQLQAITAVMTQIGDMTPEMLMAKLQEIADSNTTQITHVSVLDDDSPF